MNRCFDESINQKLEESNQSNVIISVNEWNSSWILLFPNLERCFWLTSLNVCTWRINNWFSPTLHLKSVQFIVRPYSSFSHFKTNYHVIWMKQKRKWWNCLIDMQKTVFDSSIKKEHSDRNLMDRERERGMNFYIITCKDAFSPLRCLFSV